MGIGRSFCSRQARASDIPLWGTATEVSTWLLVEVPAPWGRKALAESNLPLNVKSSLLEWETEMAGRRVQFIRKEAEIFDAPDCITAYIAHVNARPPELYQLRLDSYADLLKLKKASGEIPFSDEAFSRSKPIFLTCTNGRRDACCAKWGREMAEAVREAAREEGWQTSHLGGHRFAPTLLVLPHGSQYGWLKPDEAGSLINAHRKGCLYRLDRYRGHVGFPRPVQAAAVFLRKKIGCSEFDALTLVDAESREGNTWGVRFRSGEKTYEVRVAQEEGKATPPSCGADPKPTRRFVSEGYYVL